MLASPCLQRAAPTNPACLDELGDGCSEELRRRGGLAHAGVGRHRALHLPPLHRRRGDVGAQQQRHPVVGLPPQHRDRPAGSIGSRSAEVWEVGGAGEPAWERPGAQQLGRPGHHLWQICPGWAPVGSAARPQKWRAGRGGTRRAANARGSVPLQPALCPCPRPLTLAPSPACIRPGPLRAPGPVRRRWRRPQPLRRRRRRAPRTGRPTPPARPPPPAPTGSAGTAGAARGRW